MNMDTLFSITSAERIFARLSLGSSFFSSKLGYHRAFESVLVSSGDPLRYAAIAYFIDDSGEDAHAFVHRELFSQAPILNPTVFLNWNHPMSCRAFLPLGADRSVANVMRLTRAWIQQRVCDGWRLPEPARASGRPMRPWTCVFTPQ